MATLDPQLQRRFALDVARKLRDAGYTAYWAGGCMHDQLLGRLPKDYDVATNATPQQIRKLFGEGGTLAIGAAFGVITVLGPKPAGPVEVTTFRQDAAYSDGRHPDSVTFTTAEGDAQRRDFTINGLFFDPLAEQVIDFVGGQDDLARQVIRAIGVPQERFAEDKLRMLRAIRFASVYGFALDAPTRDAIVEMAPEVLVVSPERIVAELRTMLVHSARAAAVRLLAETGLLNATLPELGDNDVLSGQGYAVLTALKEASFPLALAALFHDRVDAVKATEIARRWRLSNKETVRLAWLVEHRTQLLGARRLRWPQLQSLLVEPGIEELVALGEGLAAVQNNDPADLAYSRLMARLPTAVLDPSPLLTGDDLLRHGVPAGPKFRWLLDEVRAAQLEERVHDLAGALALVNELMANAPRGHQ